MESLEPDIKARINIINDPTFTWLTLVNRGVTQRPFFIPGTPVDFNLFVEEKQSSAFCRLIRSGF